MSVSHSDFVAHATRLCSNGSCHEIDYRASVSHAYLACYHAVKYWNETKLPAIGGSKNASVASCGGLDEFLLDRLLNPAHACTTAQDQLSRSVGVSLRRLFFQHRLADRQLSSTVGATQAHQAIADANLILGNLPP